MTENSNLDKALKLINEKQFSQAKEILLQVVKEEPQNIEAVKSLGLANINLKLTQEALLNFQSALAIDNTDAPSWYYAGTILDQKNDFTGAQNAFLKVLELREDYLDAYKSLSIIYLKTKQHNKIIEFYDKLRQLAPDDYQTYYITALAYMGVNDFERAVDLLHIAIELNPQHAILYNNLGTAYMSLNNVDAALSAFNKAIEIEPENSISYYNLGIAYQSQNKHKDAFYYIEKAYEKDPTNFYLNAAALAAFNAEKWEAAIGYYNALIYAYPEKQNYQYNLACAYQAVQEYEKAVSILENLSVVNANTPLIAERLASIYTEIGNYEAAKNVYAMLMQQGKVSSNIYYQYALLCAKTNEMDKAEAILKKVIQLSPENAVAHKDLAIIYLTRRLFDYAKDEFETAYKLDKNNPYILFEYANYWHMISNYKEAKKYYDKLLKHEGLNTSMYLGIGINYMSLGMPRKSLEYLTKAMELAPQNADILQNTAKVYFMQKKYKVAKQLLEDAYFIDSNPEIANSLALVYLETKDFKEANKLFKLIDSQYPNNSYNILNMAKSELGLENKEKAKELLNKVLEIFPESQEAIDLLNSIN